MLNGRTYDRYVSIFSRGGRYEQANALGGFQGQQNFQRAPRPRNDPYSNTYNPGWRNHTNFSYANNSNQAAPSIPYNKPPGFTHPRQPQAYQPPPPSQATPSSQNSSLKELVKTLAMSQKNLEYQMSQMAKEISQIKAQGSGKLPSQTIMNPKENASVITLRSGKQLEVSSKPIEPSQLETEPPKSSYLFRRA